jgi:hypothetical protein
MNKIVFFIVSFICLMALSTELASQNNQLIKFRVLNNLNHKPIENASIKVQGANIGTVSSGYGYCELVVNEIPVNLEVSHIAFGARILKINFNQIHDTVNVFLDPSLIHLDEVNISAKKIDVLIQPDYSILDFDFLNDKLLVLERNETNLHKLRLILMNSVFDTITILNFNSNKKPLEIYKDCLEQCHLLTQDSAFQIGYSDSLLSLNYSMELSEFHEIMDDCLFAIDSLVFFQKIINKGYSYEYFTVNSRNKKVDNFIRSNDFERYLSLQESIAFLKKHPPSSSIYIAIDFEKRFMYQPFKQYLNLIDNSLYYFNHQNSTIDIYSKECEYLGNLNINYQKIVGWSSKILVDKTMGKAYTIINNNLLEINLSNGETVFKTKLGLAKKVLINNGYAYILKKDFNLNRFETFIRKVEL